MTLTLILPKNFNYYTLLKVNLSRLIEFTLFGSLYLSYAYAKATTTYRERIEQYNSALASNKINQLKTQLNPHFLFNNLNALDELIEEDKHKASEFLHHFSDLYRYSLVTSAQNLHPLTEELKLVSHYFSLMQCKFDDYYFLTINNKQLNNEILVPPFTLQLLIENAIEHNLGTREQPIYIEVLIDKTIQVSNNRLLENKEKSTLKAKKKTHGRALKNLSAQFSLLANDDIQIINNEQVFKVILPIITQDKND